MCAGPIAHAQDKLSFLISGGIIRDNIISVVQLYREASFLIGGGMLYVLSPGGTLLDFTGPLQISLTTGIRSWVDPLRLYSTLDAPPPGLRNSIDIPLLAGVRWQLTKTVLSPYLSTEIGIHYISREYQIVSAVFPPGTVGYY